MSKRTFGILLAALTGVFWAWLAIVLKYALHFSSTGSIIWIRMSLAALTLAILLKIFKPHSFKKVFSEWSTLSVIAGLFLSFNYYGYMHGLELTTASNAQIMIQLGPLTFLFAGVFIFKETMSIIQWLGVLLAVAGFVLFNWDQVLVAMGEWRTYLLGNVWITFAALTWTIYAVFQKKLIQKGWTPQEINLVLYIVASICLMPLVRIEDFIDKTPWQWFIYYVLALNTVIAYGAFAEAVARIPASQVSIIITANPLLTILFMELISYFGATFVSPEPIHALGYIGAILVVVGVGIAVSMKPRQKKLPYSDLKKTGLDLYRVRNS